MQNKLAATFGMPRLFPNPFSPFFPLFRRFAVAYLNAAGQQKKKRIQKKEKNLRQFCLIVACLWLGHKNSWQHFGPCFYFLGSSLFFHFLFYYKQKFLSIAGEPLIKEA